MATAAATIAGPHAVFELIGTAQREERGVALVTIVGLTGSSVRRVGSHMAVVDDGRSAGSFSGGCVEAAVVAEAQQSIAQGEARLTRFGSGSPYVDIRLPCGGGLDLLFLPNPPRDGIAAIERKLDRREPASFTLSTDEPRLTLGAPSTGMRDGYHLSHAPRLKLLILGHGEESIALARLAVTFGAEVELLSPELAIVEAAALSGAKTRLLKTQQSVSLDADRWTAVVLLFHDHDWEPPLLAQALNSPALFIGAMGSRATHEARLARLRGLGFSDDALARVHGPLGLIPAARDPQMLALSALAQVADHYRGAAA